MEYNTHLTDKQEQFAQLIALQGMNHSQAYRAVYNPDNSLDSTVWREASILANNPKVTTRIIALKDSITAPVIADTIADAIEVQSFWSSTMRDSEHSIKHRLDASELLGKSQRLFVTQVESHNTTTDFARLVEALKDTTTDELRNKVNTLKNAIPLQEDTTLHSDQVNTDYGDSGNTLEINNRIGE